jgi:hypothetical protein
MSLKMTLTETLFAIRAELQLRGSCFRRARAAFGRGAYPDDALPSFGQFTKAAPPFQAQPGAKIAFSR